MASGEMERQLSKRDGAREYGLTRCSGGGAAMRVSACGWVGRTLDELKTMSRAVTEVTHNHLEGVKGAEAEK
jgi:ADP-ribosylglycohydrolase